MKEYQVIKEMLDGTSEKSKIFTNYKDAKEKYDLFKKSDLEGIHIIKFNDIIDGEIKNRWTKKVNEKKKDITCREIAKNIDDLVKQVEEIKNHNECIIKMAERKRELLLHLITGVHTKTYQNKEEETMIKLNLVNELGMWEFKRKVAKDELRDVVELQNNNDINMKSLIKPRGIPNISKDSPSVTRNKYERIITYNNDKEKDTYLKQNKNYAYYIVDEYEKSIYFYNRFDSQKKFKEFTKALNKANNVTKLAVKDISIEEVKPIEKVNEEMKILEYRTIKQKGHFQKMYANKYKYNKDCTAQQKLYFSNNPIDLGMLV